VKRDIQLTYKLNLKLIDKGYSKQPNEVHRTHLSQCWSACCRYSLARPGSQEAMQTRTSGTVAEKLSGTS